MNKRFANAALVLIGLSLTAPAAVRAAESEKETAPRLILEIRDEGNGERTPARFSLSVDGTDYHPGELNSHGLVFTSVHESRRQVQTITYARGTGPVELALPKEARRVEVRVAKGFEYLPAAIAREVTSAVTRVEVPLVRWANLRAEGWFAADAHLHYDRLDPAADRDWFTMLAGDDLSHAHFMTAKGGQVPGEWARQYAYGAAGEGFDGERLLTAGEEYRDTAQGHINLMGLREIIQPIMAGTGKSPNYPPLNTVLLQTRELGGMPGAAHGGSLGRNPTVILDTVLGALDFMEIGNSHLYALENWYRLMNCGFHLPPTAGTDLPNFPDRDPWQPFLGGMRMYLKICERNPTEGNAGAV